MRGTLGSLDGARNLRVRGREQTRNLFGEPLVGREAGKLALPQIEVTPRQMVEVGRFVVVGGGHAATIVQPCDERGDDRVIRSRKGILVALRHRR
jgi:hypothetical protein